jgi:hypothetical protein
MEAREALADRLPSPDVLPERFWGDRRERKRWIKNRLWYKAPLFVRVYFFFFYSYILKLGFLDGRIGLVYHTLQAFWFRFLVDAKIEELVRNHGLAAEKQAEAGVPSPAPTPKSVGDSR